MLKLLSWLLGLPIRKCPVCFQRFVSPSDEGMFGQMCCRGCAWAIKQLRRDGDARFAAQEPFDTEAEKGAL